MMSPILLACLMVLAGTLILRLSGRRSIAQMTFGSVMVMLAIGTTIATPFTQKNPWITLATVAAALLTLVVIEWVQLKSRAFERVFTGKPIVIIQNGQLQVENMRKLRMTQNKLEMHLRQKGITSIKDVQTATVEPNGQLGYELTAQARPLTIRDFEQLLRTGAPNLNLKTHHQPKPDDLFRQVTSKMQDEPDSPVIH